ncbi:MAG: hypothetical protein NE330_21065 [Lentisphaeraceae bacterium]|nr:hypothetical protein [Lentisphaeraceae bacterium]
MKLTTSILLLGSCYLGAATNEQIIEAFNKETSLLRPSSKNYKELKKTTSTVDAETARQLIQKLEEQGLKNFLFLWSNTQEKKVVSTLLLEELLEANSTKKPILAFFAKRSIGVSSVTQLIELCKQNNNQGFLLELLSSNPSQEAFSYIVSLPEAKVDYLLNSVTKENIPEVLQLLKKRHKYSREVAIRLLRLTEDDSSSYSQLVFLLKKSIKEVKPSYSSEQVDKLVNEYKRLETFNLEQLQEEAKTLFDETVFPVDLHRDSYNKIITQNESLNLLLLARCMHFELQHIEKYSEHIKPLYEAETRPRLKSILFLKDQKDQSLLPVFKHLMLDGDSEVRYEATSTIAEVFEEMQSAQILQEKPSSETIRQLLNDPSESVIVATIDLISTMKEKEFNAEILKFSDNKNIEVQLAALLAIEKMEPVGGVPQLIKVLDNPNWNVRALAARALSRYDNKETYQNEIDNKYKQELDPYVKQALYDSVKSSKSQLIANMIRNQIKKAENTEIEQLYMNLFELKAVTAQDLKSALPHFYKTKNSDFIESWFDAAKEKNLDILPEAIHVVKNGDENTSSIGINILAEKKIDLLNHVEVKDLEKFNDETLWEYMESHVRLKNKTKLAILARIFSNPQAENFSYSLYKILEDKFPNHRRGTNEFSLNEDQHKSITKQIDSYKRPLNNLDELALTIYKKKELDDDAIKTLLTKDYDDQGYYSRNILAHFLKSLEKEQVNKHSDDITKLISTYKIRHYNLEKVIPNLSQKALTKIYESVSGNDKLQFLSKLAPTLSLKDLIKKLDAITLDKNSDYYSKEIFEAKAPTLKVDEVGIFLKYCKKLGIKDYYYANILKLIPENTKESFIQQLAQAKIKLEPYNITLLLSQVKEEHFPLIRKYLITYELPDASYNPYNLAVFKPSLDSYIKTDKLTKEQLIVFTKLSRHILYDQTKTDKIFTEALNYDRSIQELVFTQIEKRRRTNKKIYYQLYTSLLEAPISKKLFTEKKEDNRRIYSNHNINHRHTKKNNNFTAERTKVADLLKESIKSYNGSQKVDLCKRLASVTSADDYIEYCSSLFKDFPAIMNFIPLEGFTDESFALLEDSIDLSMLPKSVMFQLGKSLSKNLQQRIFKDFIDADETNITTLYPLVLALIDKADAKVTLKLVNSYIISGLRKQDRHNEDYNFSYQEVNGLKKALKNKTKRLAIETLISEEIYTIDHYFIMSLLGAKVPAVNLEKAINDKNTFNQNYFILETAYISKSLSSKLIDLHKNLLNFSSEKELETMVALSTSHNYLTNDNIEYDYNSSKDMLIQNLKQNNYSFGQKKDDIVEESPLTKPIEDLKFQIASKPENKHLMKYVSNNSSFSLEDVLRSWKILDEIVIDQITEKTLVQKLPKATKLEFNLFLSLLETKLLNWQTASNQVFESLNKDQMKKVTKIFYDSDSPNKQALLPSIIDNMESTEDAKRIVTTVLNGTVENYYIHTNDQKKQELFSKAVDSLYSEKKLKINANTIFLFESFRASHNIRLEIDQKYNDFPSDIQDRILRTLLRNGPYYINALRAYSKKLDGPFNFRLFVNDSSYSYNPKFEKVTTEPSIELKKVLEKLKQKKEKLYKTYSSSNPGLVVGLINHPKLFYKEYPKAFKQDTFPAWGVYSLIAFKDSEREAKLKQFIEKFKENDGANRFVIAYLKQHKIEYSWIPAKYKDEDLGDFD